jgi:hypothetical protein
MVNCELMPYQRDLIKALKPYIENQTLKDTWIVASFSDRETVVIYNIDPDLEEHGWNHIRRSDLAKFVECGFLSITDYDQDGLPNNYMVNEANIFGAIERNFN